MELNVLKNVEKKKEYADVYYKRNGSNCSIAFCDVVPKWNGQGC